MSKIAVVGAGQAGLLAAHALHDRGYEVTLYSDKTPDDFLNKARPTGTAARFPMTLDFERELGLEHWGDIAPHGEGIHLTYGPKKGNRLLTMLGRFDDYCMAVDLRLQSATWMRELDEKGARVEIEQVSVERLEEIAAGSDLTVVAAGRGDIMKLFPRDDARSTYDAPQRQLAMVNVTGPSMTFPSAPYYTPVKFNLFAAHGEAFWVPWLSKDLKKSWSLVFEAKEGGPIDRFRGAKSAEETLQRAKEVIKDLMPWDYEWVRDAEPCDDNSWLVGSFTPAVRRAVGTLPSGRSVMALGDTAQSLDPIGGQGANNGNKMTRNLVECVAERGEGPFDAAWMEETQDRFWARHSYIDYFNNTLLEPIKKAGITMLIAQYGSTARPGDDSPQQRVANAISNNWNDPMVLTDAFHDEGKAKKVVREAFGGATLWPLAKGGARIAAAQLRQKVGLAPAHPGT